MKSAFFMAAIMAAIRTSVAQTTTSEVGETVTSAPTTSPSSTTRGPVTTTVSVGVNHKFIPDTVSALPGDTIKFEFFPSNHSVVKAAYKYPCVPYDYIEPGEPTFFSGPELSNAGDPHPTWLLEVNSTEPTFFYCSAPGSCQDWAMVGVINPNESFSLDVQKEFQKNVTFQLSPGEPWPAEAPRPTTTGSGTTPSETGSGGNNGSGGSGGTSLSGGAIAGIAIGGAAVLIIVVALIWFCGRKGGIEKGYRKSTVMQPSTPGMVEAHYPNDPKSPPPPSFRDSPYGMQSAEAFRSTSPQQWSQTGSPHASYRGYPSPGLGSPQPWQEVHPQHTGQSGYSDHPKPPTEAPVELPGHPTSPPAERHEFPG
ncbi:hypothetical protein JX265_009012 [Neoarthrinium moseri]|uniref:Extracellular serine-rich protein n=1 Tax=Neoarthrinium moseri TaxID=1658444 RepID=A0A9P9WH73_9PEZI|nr:uncharacterized protein JN550_007882 [Neoarthrinium moseri]KAI1846685.1 hypothetical protein JX266_007258 [Neoarthrinium moseri]KAI1862966.1 hypothetical protein JX265_009012 [Neoarthrinium moseri]KAI1866193.1 hypothetical protein JN550_007882 [Neoarthrinium moseri]